MEWNSTNARLAKSLDTIPSQRETLTETSNPSGLEHLLHMRLVMTYGLCLNWSIENHASMALRNLYPRMESLIDSIQEC